MVMPFARSAFLLILSLAASTSWAAGGWYLLVPPMSDYNERAEFLYGIDILDKKPLAQWAQETAYDSASACETAKTQRVTEEHTRYQKSADAYIQSLRAGTDPTALRGQRILAESNYATTAAFVASRCVYSDDPRLRP